LIQVFPDGKNVTTITTSPTPVDEDLGTEVFTSPLTKTYSGGPITISFDGVAPLEKLGTFKVYNTTTNQYFFTLAVDKNKVDENEEYSFKARLNDSIGEASTDFELAVTYQVITNFVNTTEIMPGEKPEPVKPKPVIVELESERLKRVRREKEAKFNFKPTLEKVKGAEKEKGPEPTLKIGSITPEANIKLKFSDNLKVPSNFEDFDYESVFKL
jgi:hypothetical protein